MVIRISKAILMDSTSFSLDSPYCSSLKTSEATSLAPFRVPAKRRQTGSLTSSAPFRVPAIVACSSLPGTSEYRMTTLSLRALDGACAGLPKLGPHCTREHKSSGSARYQECNLVMACRLGCSSLQVSRSGCLLQYAWTSMKWNVDRKSTRLNSSHL